MADPHDNLLNRQFDPAAPNEACVAMPTFRGELHAAEPNAEGGENTPVADNHGTRRGGRRMRLQAGMKLAHYQILAPLGAGGMGEVSRAHDARLDRDVAIKVLPERLANSGEALARFEREAKALAALSHANLVAIFDV